MTTLQNKIDFAVIFRVSKANPNGDPLNGNRPRIDYGGFGEVTDVCIKRKIRDRLLERWVADGKQDNGNMIFVQSDDRKQDDAPSLRARAEDALGNKLGSSETVKLACEKWFDVRAFGQLFALKKSAKKKKGEEGDEDTAGVSIGIRGPVTVQSAFSVEPVSQFVTSTQITKSVSGEGDGSKRGSDTMGMKHRVDRGTYVFFGSMNPQLAERTGFSDVDSEAVKNVLPKLFENDASSARAEGNMEAPNVILWTHNSKSGRYSSAKVHRTLSVNPDGSYELASLDGMIPDEIKGFLSVII